MQKKRHSSYAEHCIEFRCRIVGATAPVDVADIHNCLEAIGRHRPWGRQRRGMSRCCRGVREARPRAANSSESLCSCRDAGAVSRFLSRNTLTGRLTRNLYAGQELSEPDQ
jgi:hypothetical protein